MKYPLVRFKYRKLNEPGISFIFEFRIFLVNPLYFHLCIVNRPMFKIRKITVHALGK